MVVFVDLWATEMNPPAIPSAIVESLCDKLIDNIGESDSNVDTVE